jgi:flagellar basal-body rod protein FlgB
MIDTGLDLFRQVLALRAFRQEILSADIANASTPGYKALDLDFASALGAVAARGQGVTPQPVPRRARLVDDPRHISPTADPADVDPQFVKYQDGNEVTLDGNSVDLDREKVEAAANAVQYEAAATFASQTIRMLMIAITGSGTSSSNGS